MPDEPKTVSAAFHDKQATLSACLYGTLLGMYFYILGVVF